MIKKEEIIEMITNNQNRIENVILIRLYEEYLYQQEMKNKTNKCITAIDIIVAYENIEKEFNKKIKKQIPPFDNNETYEKAREYYLILQDNINNFKFNNKTKVNNTIMYITYLELLMNIPVTFDTKIMDLLDKKIEEYKPKKIKRIK